MRRHALPVGAVTRARTLRLGATPAERRLWLALCEGLPEARFRRQAPMGAYIVDFCSHAARLVVEVDGSQHQEAQAYDEARTRFIIGEGYRVLRFWNNEVLGNLDGVLTAILAALPEDLPARKRVREEQAPFASLGSYPNTLRPPCGGERREAAAEGGAERSSARPEGPPFPDEPAEALRALAGRPLPSTQPSPLRGEGAHRAATTVALRAAASGGHPPPSLPHKGGGGIDNLRLEPVSCPF